MADRYDRYHQAGDPENRSFRCFDSGLFALLRGDTEAYRSIALLAVKRCGDTSDFWTLNALRTATLCPESPVDKEKLVEIARRLVARGRNDGWYGWHRIELGDALFRAGRAKEALATLEEYSSEPNGKAVVALIHARGGDAEAARRWLSSLERDLEQNTREAHLSLGSLPQQGFGALDVFRAELLRREAHAALGEKAPELRALRLLRADALWRLGELQKAEAEFTAAIDQAPDLLAALIDRAHTMETLGLKDRADLDLAEAARRMPLDPRPWVARGKLLSERGQSSEADTAYARAAALAPERLDPFLAAPWWVAGPYSADMAWAQPPEQDHDPARRARNPSASSVEWKPAFVSTDRTLRLGRFAGQPPSSVYAMTHLGSTRERTALICLGFEGRARVWLNDRVVFDSDQQQTRRYGLDYLVPVTLRTGRNTLLVRLSHDSSDHTLRLRSDDLELDHARLFEEMGLWPEAADAFDRAGKLNQFSHAWAKARQVELLAGLGEKGRFLRAAAHLADWDGASRPDPYDVVMALGMMPNDCLSPERLIELAKQTIADNPKDVWRKQPLALAYYRAGQFRAVLDHLTAHIPADYLVEAPIRAMAHWRLGEKDAARKSLARVDARFETWCRGRSNTRDYANLNWWFDGPQLVALRREAHTLIDGKAPDDTAALAKVRAEQGDLIDHRDSPTWAYDMALRLDPTSAVYRYSLAARLIELGRVTEAEPLLLSSVEAGNKDPQAWVDRGVLLARAGLPDRAAADFAHALDLVPEDFNTWGPRAKLCMLMAGQPTAFEALLNLRKSDALLWYIRAGAI